MRLVRGLDASRLAKRLRISERQLLEIESGRRRIDDLRLSKAAISLDARISYFFEDFPPSTAEADAGSPARQRLKLRTLGKPTPLLLIAGKPPASAEVEAITIG